MTVYPFVRAKYYTVGAISEVRAFLWHMAEGYGTVSWLTHPTNNNSAHFVIERSGRIVQMVKFTDASHSAHVNVDPDDSDASDCGGTYSDATGRKVLGTGWTNINRYVISVEVEGYRKDGPNADQVAAIARLYRDLRSRFPKARGNLGHRDVQDYKSCPGCKFPWSLIDGHGLFNSTPATTETAMRFDPYGTEAGALIFTKDSHLWRVRDGAEVDVKAGLTRRVYTLVRYAIRDETTPEREGYLVQLGDEAHIAPAGVVTFSPDPAIDTAALERAAFIRGRDKAAAAAKAVTP